ncbi:T9SS type A sorting domain-containing protein [Flammeovirga pectinis]|uniref:T9SS type A sorting domain-containing protein n=1 Tax=Flammeovirga pectinis TaxID=2494373 RepID=A0A3Q9FSL3_9BACT|nr:LamG-like jellyroll fold domain-containing protein [Flammeovirga pectinis]AZQ64177.1 T9SS type A sorting domain-containing protein [Flammeovirga pectinis]
MKKILLLLMFITSTMLGVAHSENTNYINDDDLYTETPINIANEEEEPLLDKIYNFIFSSKNVTYSTTTFHENEANNGTIRNTIEVTLSGTTFNGSQGTDLIGSGAVEVKNLPSGLSPYVIINSSNTATITLNGIANVHRSQDDISNIQIIFKNSAFSGSTASQVSNSTKSNVEIDFIDGFSSGNTVDIDDEQRDPQIDIVIGFNNVLGEQIDEDGTYLNIIAGTPFSPVHTSTQYEIFREEDTGLTDSETIQSGKILIGFPWDIFYNAPTFTRNSFEVSKGYYNDKTSIQWQVSNNSDLITFFKIYRREFDPSNENHSVNYKLVATLDNTSYSYDDYDVEGGVLQEYKVVADGLGDLEIEYTSFITGIGFRNPTATITGNITFEGGNPVQDVIVRAQPQGGEIVLQSFSAKVNGTGYVESKMEARELPTDFTLQSWFKFDGNSSGELFKMFNGSSYYDLDYIKSDNDIKLTLHSPSLSKDITFTLTGSLPNGESDGAGEDIIIPYAEVMEEFNNFSLVLSPNDIPKLYFNGRLMDGNYSSTIPAEISHLVDITTVNTDSITYQPITGDKCYFRVADGFKGYFDDIRIWSSALSNDDVQKNYRRYLSGAERGLEIYLRIDEGTGSYAYDLSKEEFTFHKRHSFLLNTEWSQETPTITQLGIFGVTDMFGNYVITSIPYAGNGGSYAVTPMFGVHEFDPGQQVVFIGEGSEVINKLDFKDISSFIFRGIAYFDVRGQYSSLRKVDDVTQIEDAGYNQYLVTIDGTKIMYNQGHYFKNEIGELYEYPKIFLDEANVYVDGNMVLDENKSPVVTGKDGFFQIQVPIGNHYVEVRKNGHGLVHDGRFPAEGYYEFFENHETPKPFVDTTRVSVVGRVVGGQVEAEKLIGFGFDGIKEVDFFHTADSSETVVISSTNNLGTAKITFDYLPYGADPATGYLSTSFYTNNKTGEYKAELIPINYIINEVSGAVIESNPDVILLSGSEEVDYSPYTNDKRAVFKDSVGNEIQSEPYKFVQNFIYRSTPQVTVENQTYEFLVSEENDTSVTYPVYEQLYEYQIDLLAFEEYENKEINTTFTVPVTDGQYYVTNNLARSSSDRFEKDPEEENKVTYYFTAGLPLMNAPFRKGMSVMLRIKDVDYAPDNLLSEGIIFGGKSDGSQLFVTKAPDIPDIILRDPPGSGSSASIEAGTELTIETSMNALTSSSFEQGLTLKLGTTVTTGGADAGPENTVEAVNDVESGFSVSYNSDYGEGFTKSYSFSQTISTSDSEGFVGSDGDLYIGHSKNLQYGSYNRLSATDTIVKGIDNTTFIRHNDDGSLDTVYINKQKALYFNEAPSSTFFIYSQKHIITTLIPEYESFITALENGSLDSDDEGVLSKTEYETQIKLWQEIIQNNERTKYRAFNDQDNFLSEVIASITANEDQYNLDHNNSYTQNYLNFVNKHFKDNISIDYGVGGVERTVSTFTASGSSYAYEVALDYTFAHTFGKEINDTGDEVTTSFGVSQGFAKSDASESAESTSFTYSIVDNDDDNYLSIDVVNPFDGNGPIFRTLGGRTSCPHEGPLLSNYFDSENYEQGVIGAGGTALAIATQAIEVPVISANVTDITNIPEDDMAVIELTLLNNTNADLNENVSFMLYIDNTTNPHNIKSNIPQGGVEVEVPHDQTVTYTVFLEKSKPDVYDYEDLSIVLESICMGSDLQESVEVSVHYVPSCTRIEVQKPLEKWVMNATTAFNDDGSTNPLPIILGDYSRTYDSFEKVRLEYRKSTSPTWTRLYTYYNNAQSYADAVAAQESKIDMITDDNITFSWDIGATGLSDGDYEIRAISYCDNGTEYISDVVPGKVDLNIPVAFGTPSPRNGILSAGQDLTLKYSENILYNSAISNIEIVGQTNDQEIAHGTSVYFEGSNNTATFEKPSISDQNFTIEFWMRNLSTEANSIIFKQENGMEATLSGNTLTWTVEGSSTYSVSSPILDDDLFHHYVFVYDGTDSGTLRMYQDDQELGFTNTGAFAIPNRNNLVFGGSTFKGNILELRIWSKALSLSDAYAQMYKSLLGSEQNLQGYWPMDEGRENVVNDKARNKHGIMNAEWDIRPKGTAYNFENNDYLTLDNVNFVQLSSQMDVTLSFWVKMDQSQEATIFSNGKGDGTDVIEANGKANKWSVDVHTNGKLYLNNEGIAYELTNDIVDGEWHHVAIVLNRLGAMKTYVDADLTTSNIANDITGLSGNKYFIGARGFNNNGTYEIDQKFVGKIDELRLWNLARTKEQISRDRYFEVDFSTTGIMLYARMNEPDPLDNLAPTYYHMDANNIVSTSTSIMVAATPAFDEDAPALKPKRNLEMFAVTHVINGDEMIINPIISNWSVLEGQVIDITVSRLFDEKGNRQVSPITWTAYIRKNQVVWSVKDGLDYVNLQNYVGINQSFDITVENFGGTPQDFNIKNVPTWLTLSQTSGQLDPDSRRIITAEVNNNLSVGEYTTDLYLDTEYNYDEKIKLDLRVLENEPDWSADATQFGYNMNVVGKIKIDNIYAEDAHTKIGVFVDKEPRGEAELIYDENWDDYFLYLTIYSDAETVENLSFKIWDATTGRVLDAEIDGNATIAFVQDQILGTKATPSIFSNTNVMEQSLALNQGWTWVSLAVSDTRFNDLDALTSEMQLSNGDRIVAQSEFDVYDQSIGWSGSISSNAGMTNVKMYKMKLADANDLELKGDMVDNNNFEVTIANGWNWLPYPVLNNLNVNDALAYYEASNGDIIKGQNHFAVYNDLVGWVGTLSFLKKGEGYMLKSNGISQQFAYPKVFSNARQNGESDNSDAFENNAYEFNMSTIVEVPDGYDQVYVYNNEHHDIRGVGNVIEIEGRNLAFITVYGNADENLTFSLKDNLQFTDAGEEFVFEDDAVYGTFITPIQLGEVIASNEDIDLNPGSLKVYPNPSSSEFNLSFQLDKGHDYHLIVYSMNGRVVEKQDITGVVGANIVTIGETYNTGVYVVEIITSDGTFTERIIKK